MSASLATFALLTPVSDDELDDLSRRLATTRRARLVGNTAGDRGMDAHELTELIEHWRARYDWRTHEARILSLPWEEAEVGGRAVRFVHRRASAPDAATVVLLHGWPDSVLRFERLLPELADLNLVAPALPGFPFSAEASGQGVPTTEGADNGPTRAWSTGTEVPGAEMTITATARIVADLMQALGYERYVASGGDIGGDVAEHLALLRPQNVASLHLTNISPLHAVFADRSELGPEELAYLDAVAAWQRTEGGYIAEQSSKPHTLAVGLADSPAGLAAWIIEKLNGWSDAPFPVEDLLTWVSVYWFTGAIGTSFAPYSESVRPPSFVPTPTVLGVFGRDTKPEPRSFASRFVDVREYVRHDRGGHFAAWEEPQAYAADVRRAIALADASGGWEARPELPAPAGGTAPEPVTARE
ncbi:epoxide hydrolase [Planctomonas sp. JC2975]|uniref:epoxide hydrolase family protein n=1 Tax=Planctomonas sp. JC2975 TaxID=2729626 RepID=UPI001473EE58|nr:epoxide hydrolase family protein [Planctomonas sp. JC2975]NNC10925.1 epoxide hydrolase [Planctomonas sp. JC2975]